MVFSSIIFLFLFLPLFLIIYYLFFIPSQYVENHRLKSTFIRLSNAVLLLFSMLFYFWGENWLIAIMLTSTAVDYCCGLYIGYVKSEGARKAGLIVSVVTNLAMLSFFKYYNFGIDSVNMIARQFGSGGPVLEGFAQMALPLGISFYTFQSMSYTIDVYRSIVPPTKNFIDFSCYVTMFPQLVAGPIVRYRDVADQLTYRRLNLNLFSSGVTRFVIGLGKKAIIADTLVIATDRIYSIPYVDLTPGLAWTGAICFTVQAYFDFSGYSDMAIGLGRMLGFEFLENFNHPYVCRSITEFWQRWHISLSTWFRDYLYIPMGGNRRNPARVYFNLLTIFVLCGFWHGANWTFIAFGFYQGLFMILERQGLKERIERLPRPLGHLYGMLAVISSLALFRSENMEQAVAFLMSMAGFRMGAGQVYQVPLYLTNNILWALVVGSILAMPLLPAARKLKVKTAARLGTVGSNIIELTWNLMHIAALLVVLVLAAAFISSGGHHPFIYFKF